MSDQDIKKEQKQRAARLHRQIEEIKNGKMPETEKINNPRYFIAEKMRELAEEEQKESEERDLLTDE